MKATRDAYGDWLKEAGKLNKDIVVVDADLSESTKTNVFAKEFPDRFIDVGSAEQNLIDISAGLALGGKKVFASSFAIFETGRAWDQIRNVVSHDELNVTLVATHAGLSCAADGASHQALEDIALMRVIPNMKVIVPCDADETKNALDALLNTQGPAYMRLRREKEPLIEKKYNFKLGKAETLREGSDITIIATGMMVSYSLKAADILKEKGISSSVLNVHTIKPLDSNTLCKTAKNTGIIVTVEEHSIFGGLGGAVSEAVSETYPVPIFKIGVNDTFGQSARSFEPLLKAYGLTPDQIAETSEKYIKKIKR
ncbi:transketolase family protein [Candidatus Bathyarchaeota archaeon]|nr:transketolase family protein [Candidatus Bathyarchaeota archaeon]